MFVSGCSTGLVSSAMKKRSFSANPFNSIITDTQGLMHVKKIYIDIRNAARF